MHTYAHTHNTHDIGTDTRTPTHEIGLFARLGAGTRAARALPHATAVNRGAAAIGTHARAHTGATRTYHP